MSSRWASCHPDEPVGSLPPDVPRSSVRSRTTGRLKFLSSKQQSPATSRFVAGLRVQ